MDQKNTKKKITNKHYRQFLEEGVISTLNREDLEKVLNNIEYKYAEHAKHLVVILFMTGCRPKEGLMLKPRNFKKDKHYLKILIPAVKRGVSRTVYLSMKDPLVKDLYEWTKDKYPELVLFWPLVSTRKRSNIKAKLRDGTVKVYDNEYHDTTHKLRHWFKKWFSILDPESYTPYFLRHNHFSRLSEKGASMQDIMILKGARSMESVRPYLHMSSQQAKKMARLNLD